VDAERARVHAHPAGTPPVGVLSGP
jgi:hypothetical protein